MCLALCGKVNSPARLTSQPSSRSTIGSISLLPMPESQHAGSTVNGPKNAKLPHRVTRFDPRICASFSATKAETLVDRPRVRTYSLSPPKDAGSGSPRKVPKPGRMIRSSSSKSSTVIGRTVTFVARTVTPGPSVVEGLVADSSRRAAPTHDGPTFLPPVRWHQGLPAHSVLVSTVLRSPMRAEQGTGRFRATFPPRSPLAAELRAP